MKKKKGDIRRSAELARAAIKYSRAGRCHDARRMFDMAQYVERGGLSAAKRREVATIVVGNCKRRAPKVAAAIRPYTLMGSRR